MTQLAGKRAARKKPRVLSIEGSGYALSKVLVMLHIIQHAQIYITAICTMPADAAKFAAGL
jgi:hypothetical protein